MITMCPRGDLNTKPREISPDGGIFHEASIAGRPPRAMYLSSPHSLPGSERTAAPCRPGLGPAWPALSTAVRCGRPAASPVTLRTDDGSLAGEISADLDGRAAKLKPAGDSADPGDLFAARRRPRTWQRPPS